MLIAIICLFCTLAALAGAAVLIGATVIANTRLLEHIINARTDEILDAVEENKLQQQITRSYLVEVLEKKLLPHVGYREPKRSAVEQSMLDHWQNDVLPSMDCGEIPQS